MILGNVTESGINRIQGVRFTIAKPEALQDAARVKAMKDAKRKALLYAQAAEVRLLKPLSINESVSYPRPMYFAARSEQAAPSVLVAAGELTVTVTVNVVYVIDNT